MENKIPKNFVINNIPFKILYKKDNDDGTLGCFSALKQHIKLFKHSSGIKISKEMMDNTYYHELAHCLLWTSGGDWENELLVQSLGTSLQQYFNSVVYE